VSQAKARPLFKHLHHKSLVITDGFMAFRSLWNVVAFTVGISASGIYANPDNKIFHWVNTMIGNVKRAANGTNHPVNTRQRPLPG